MFGAGIAALLTHRENSEKSSIACEWEAEGKDPPLTLRLDMRENCPQFGQHLEWFRINTMRCYVIENVLTLNFPSCWSRVRSPSPAPS